MATFLLLQTASAAEKSVSGSRRTGRRGGGLQADVISVRPTRDITSGYKDASAIERLDWTAISLHRVPVTVGKIGGDSM